MSIAFIKNYNALPASVKDKYIYEDHDASELIRAQYWFSQATKNLDYKALNEFHRIEVELLIKDLVDEDKIFKLYQRLSDEVVKIVYWNSDFYRESLREKDHEIRKEFSRVDPCYHFATQDKDVDSVVVTLYNGKLHDGLYRHKDKKSNESK